MPCAAIMVLVLHPSMMLVPCAFRHDACALCTIMVLVPCAPQAASAVAAYKASWIRPVALCCLYKLPCLHLPLQHVMQSCIMKLCVSASSSPPHCLCFCNMWCMMVRQAMHHQAVFWPALLHLPLRQELCPRYSSSYRLLSAPPRKMRPSGVQAMAVMVTSSEGAVNSSRFSSFKSALPSALRCRFTPTREICSTKPLACQHLWVMH